MNFIYINYLILRYKNKTFGMFLVPQEGPWGKVNPNPRGNHCCDFYRLASPVLELHVNRLKQHVVLCVYTIYTLL